MKRGVIFFLAAVAMVWGYAYAQPQHHEMGTEGMHEQMTTGQTSSGAGSAGICPVMKMPASRDYSYTYKGKTYYFCCSECPEEFKANPEKYISGIKEFKIEAYRFGYEPAVITAKKGDIVKLDVTSRDVAHGINIKEYNINERVEKGKTTHIEFVADKKGSFDILCSVYCGSGHAAMKAKLVVQ